VIDPARLGWTASQAGAGARNPGGALGTLAAHFKAKADLLKDACALLNDRFRIEEQKPAMTTVTARS
jgi:hypothetical protein